MYYQAIQFSSHFLGSPRGKQLAFSPKLKSGFCDFSGRVYKSRTTPRKKVCSALTGSGESMIELEERSDDYYMRRCVEIARTAIGCTSPNPMVGCVIVNDGKVVGEGFHPKAGQPHAEVFALREAGELAENGTAYVSLEPCNHYGRTPPCTEALIKAGVRKVVVGMVDPNPIVASTGVKRLQDAGIQVVVGVEEQLCRRLNEAYIHRMLTGRPFVTLRYSMSLSGHLVEEVGEEALSCGGYYSKLLQEYDAVILSSGTHAANSPFPVSHEPGANQPLRIMLPKSASSLTQVPAASEVLVISVERLDQLVAAQEGIPRVVCDRLSLLEILDHCRDRGLSSILLDLKGASADFDDIVREGVEKKLIQKVVVEVLPVLGGGVDRMNLNARLKKLAPIVSGESLLLEGYLS